MTARKREEVALFKRFLVENHIYKSFIDNLENEKNYFKDDYSFDGLKSFIEKHDAGQFISYSFDWSESPNGHDFWEHLDWCWRDKLRKHVYANS